MLAAVVEGQGVRGQGLCKVVTDLFKDLQQNSFFSDIIDFLQHGINSIQGLQQSRHC